MTIHERAPCSDDTTLNKRQLLFAMSAAGGFFTDGYTLLILSIAMLGIVPALHLRPLDVGILVSAAFVGMVVGAAVAGPLADRHGRKPLFVIDMLLFMVASALFLFVQTTWELVILRFAIGVAIGADMPASSAMITEISPRTRRGTLNSLGSIFWTIGSVVGGLVALAVFAGGSFEYWRWILASGVVPAGFLLYLRWTMPETPRWLASAGKDEEATRSSADLGMIDFGLPAADPGQSPSGRNWRTLLTRSGYPRSLLFLATYWFLNNGYGAAILLYQPTAIQSLALTGIYAPILATVVTAAIAVVVGAATCFYLIESLGRRAVGITGTIIVGLCFLILGLSVGTPTLNVVVYCITIIVVNGVTSATFFAWAPELFPTAIRGTALGLVNSVGKAGAIFGTFVMPLVLSSLGKPTFLVLAICAFFNAAQSFFLAPETAGRSLDELEEEFRSQ